MDSEPDWTASALFSPSKARIAQAQAQDWLFVDTWLARKYAGKRPPAFERDEETLEALLALATVNDHADEQRSTLDKVEKAALTALTKKSPNADVYELISGQLNAEGRQSLDALAQTAVVLDVPLTSSSTDLATAAISLQQHHFELSQLQHRLAHQTEAARSDMLRLKPILRELDDDAFQSAPDLPEKTSDWTRNSKHLKAKIGEYDERYAVLRPPNAALEIENVVKQNDILYQQHQRHKLGTSAGLLYTTAHLLTEH